jgi:hypothetical protein
MSDALGPMGRMTTPRRVRQDLDVVIVGDGGAGPALGRVVQLVDGRWALTVPVAGGAVEVRGDRDEGSRPAALVLLRAAGALGD